MTELTYAGDQAVERTLFPRRCWGAALKALPLPDLTPVPALGQDTWRMGEDIRLRQREITALRVGIDHGMTLIDTAEMYGDGATEMLLGEALTGLRHQVFLVSKVYPQNASRGRIERACEARSPRPLRHRQALWRDPVPGRLAWVLRDPMVIAIPKAASTQHVIENRGALDLPLTPEDLTAIDADFPPPKRRTRLAML